jgi:hypothetical protein
MKKIITIIVLVVSLNIQSQTWEWVKLIQPSNVNTNPSSVSSMAIKVSPHDGYVYAAGTFNNSLNLGNSQVLNGNQDGYIAKFDTAGACQWSQRVYVTAQGCGCNIEGNTSSLGIVGFDSNGNIIVAGSYCGCGETYGSSVTTSATGYNLILAKYSPAGVCLWAKTKPGAFDTSTGQTFDDFYGFAIDDADNLYVTMFNYATSTTFCGLSFSIAADYLFKVNTNGVGIWKKATDNNSVTTTGYAITSLQYYNKRIYAGASYLGTQAFGTYTFTSSGSTDVANLKMDTAGNILAAADIKGTGTELNTNLAISKNKVIFLSNTQNGSSVVTIGTHTINTGSGQDQTFLVSYDTSLNIKNYRNTANDNKGSGQNLFNDNYGDIFVMASNGATTSFGNLSSVPAGSHIIKMNDTLTNYWHMESVNFCASPDALGNLYIIDNFTTSATYGPLTNTASGAGITLGKISNAFTTGMGGRMAAQTSTLQVYPNPSTGLFNLQLGTNVKHNNAKITLYDISGRVIADNIPFTKQDESTLQIDLSTFAEGSYIIKAEVDNVLYSAKLER